MATVTGWFDTQRSLAVSLVSAGMGVAPMTVSPFARWLVSLRLAVLAIADRPVRLGPHDPGGISGAYVQASPLRRRRPSREDHRSARHCARRNSSSSR